MLRTCNGLELRDQIPPLPPEVALGSFDPNILLDHHILNIYERNLETLSLNTCRLHGSPKTSSATVSPLHRSHNIDLMDDTPLTFPKENHTNSPASVITPIVDHPPPPPPTTTTPRRQPTTSTSQHNQPSSSNVDLDSSIRVKSGTSQQQVVPKPDNVRHRWHTCPELHKAMDGVTYIADHTKKEEESTKV